MQRLPIALALPIVWLTALASVAIATPRTSEASEIQPGNTSGTAFLGYSEKPEEVFRVHLSTANSNVVVLYVEGGPLREVPSQEWTKYAVRPRRALAGETLRADFGSIGSVSLRFKRIGETKLGRVPDRCAGARPRRESGVYRGSISLRGENGYFRLHRVVAKGRRVRTFRLLCDPGHAANPTAVAPLTEFAAPRLSSFGDVRSRLETVTEAAGLSSGFLATSAGEARTQSINALRIVAHAVADEDELAFS